MVKQYRGFTLDPFQAEAIEHLEQGRSVLVSAPTGTGKTLIADYLIEKTHSQGKRVVYTAPIKALSNQKYKEYKRLFGEDVVGILTGDLVINPDADVLLMTTEVFRNQLHLTPEKVADTAYVIFDEIHYIDDPQRGSVWEESIVFMPEHMRLLGLSATIPNARELADWIELVHGEEVQVVRCDRRAVPLSHHYFEKQRGVMDYSKVTRLQERLEERRPRGKAIEQTTHLDLIEHLGPDYMPCLFFTFSRRRCESNATELAARHDFATDAIRDEVDQAVAETLERYKDAGGQRLAGLRELMYRGVAYHHAGMLPVLKDIVEQAFGRRLISVLYCTETFAVGLNFPCRTVCFESYTKYDGIDFRPLSNREYFQMAGRAGRRGIDERGYVFTLVDAKYLRGRPVPKWDESQIEPLTSQFRLSYNTVLNLVRSYTNEEIEELLTKNFAAYQTNLQCKQMEGRIASLRQQLDRLDSCEHFCRQQCPVLYGEAKRELKKYQRLIDRLPRGSHNRGRRRTVRDKIKKLSHHLANVALQNCPPEQVRICRKRTRRYRRLSEKIVRLEDHRAQLEPASRFFAEFEEKKNLLRVLDYVRDDELTARGKFAARTHVQELLVTELYFQGVFHQLDVDQLNAVAVAIDYEPRREEDLPKRLPLDVSHIVKTAKRIQHLEEVYVGQSTVLFNPHQLPQAYAWSRGASFEDVVAASSLDEGDVVYAFRRGMDVLRQIRAAAEGDEVLRTRIAAALKHMDRDEVSIVL